VAARAAHCCGWCTAFWFLGVVGLVLEVATVTRHKAEVKEEILRYLKGRTLHDCESQDVATFVAMPKNTINTYLKELEDEHRLIRHREGYKVYWEVKAFTITRQLILRIAWTPNSLKQHLTPPEGGKHYDI
jgi:predicted transcriptional regulator